MSIRQGDKIISPVKFLGDAVKVVKLTKTAYMQIAEKDPATMYVIIKDNEL